MELGAILAVVIAAPAAIAIARSIAHWLRRRDRIHRDRIHIAIPGDAGTLVPLERIAELLNHEQKARGGTEEERKATEAGRKAEEEGHAAEARREAEEEGHVAEARREAGEERHHRDRVEELPQYFETLHWAKEERRDALPPPPQVTDWHEIRRERNGGGLQSRVIDANLLTERFAPGEIATLTVVIRLPDNPARGKWQSSVTLRRDRGPVHVILETMGFTCLSEPPPPFEVPEDRDTAPVAFELRIEEASRRWLHIVLIQEGRPFGELTINDFSAMGDGASQQVASSPLRMISEADLTLLVRAGDGRIEVCSPRDRAKLDTSR